MPDSKVIEFQRYPIVVEVSVSRVYVSNWRAPPALIPGFGDAAQARALAGLTALWPGGTRGRLGMTRLLRPTGSHSNAH
jgi:hypothetical protein